ncbi:DUF4238 domain-containing protein [Ureibacillus endophyticus]|uniref:DUF4238 domain-containing protein n=1 Tax=Ureibacillus endophyticus TaxID=1978490 RepID=A0A494ZAM7_9BACL|nr:DUF4238 domain-containing protein [Lysinibacillus endophyticus]RKQ19109.1 DUF4238 domain-containing protein [Lysinibacillus endophyticus]
MGKVKNQHYVPRSYLKYFANKKNKAYQINVYDKENDKYFSSNIEGVASSRFFYDFPELEEIKEDLMEEMDEITANEKITELGEIDEQPVEKHFSELEGEFHGLLNNLRSRFKLCPKPEESLAINLLEKFKLSHHLIFQLMRTRDFRDTYLDMEQRFTQYLVDEFAKNDIPDYKLGSFQVDRNEKYNSLTHASFIFSDALPELSLTLNKHIWFIGINRSNTPFYTSDNPVVRYPHKNESFRSNSGIASQGIEIAFPISEELIIIIREREYFKDFEDIENTFTELNGENVNFYNWLQIKDSYKQIYTSEEKFELIEEIKKSNPQILKHRNRVEIFAGGRKI